MRANRKIVAAMSIAALGITAAAAPALAQEAEPDPPEQPFQIFANIESEGELLPICLNVVRVTLFGTTLVDVPKTCVLG